MKGTKHVELEDSLEVSEGMEDHAAEKEDSTEYSAKMFPAHASPPTAPELIFQDPAVSPSPTTINIVKKFAPTVTRPSEHVAPTVTEIVAAPPPAPHRDETLLIRITETVNDLYVYMPEEVIKLQDHMDDQLLNCQRPLYAVLISWSQPFPSFNL